MALTDPDIIVSRFNKHKAVRGKYLLERGFIDDGGEHLLMMQKDTENFTLVTAKTIKGSWRGDSVEEPHSTGELHYDIINEAGEIIFEKDDLSAASGVIINGRSRFWLPNDAVLPFCNLLNFLH